MLSLERTVSQNKYLKTRIRLDDWKMSIVKQKIRVNFGEL